MAKITVLIVLIFSLTACNEPIPSWVGESAALHCGGKEKIHQIFYDDRTMIGSVTCKNGIYYEIQLQGDK